MQSSSLPRTSVQGAVETAIAAGYRHIDTAYSYNNELDIGKALRSKMEQGIIRRQDMFIVSKVGAAGPECNTMRGNSPHWFTHFVFFLTAKRRGGKNICHTQTMLEHGQGGDL